jgi:hypothetical protein
MSNANTIRKMFSAAISTYRLRIDLNALQAGQCTMPTMISPSPKATNTRNRRDLIHRTGLRTSANTNACSDSISKYNPIRTRQPSPQGYDLI